MMDFATKRLPQVPDVVAPDGSDVRVLARTGRGGMAHFELAPGRASDAIRHRTVDEIWFVLSGRGEIWRKQRDRDEIFLRAQAPRLPGFGNADFATCPDLQPIRNPRLLFLRFELDHDAKQRSV